MSALLLCFCMLFFLETSSFAEDDIFEKIEGSLRSAPKVSQEKREHYLSEFFSSIANSDNYIGYKEIYLSGLYSHDLHKVGGRNSLGFLLYGTFPGHEGQLGDLNIQGRATYYSNQFAHGELMPNEYTRHINQLKLELHNAYLRVRAFPPMMNARAGHFYVPFGLQPWIDTHGTLLQGPAMEFIGMDRDWGVSLDGQNEHVEYQAGLTRGSGMEYFKRRGNFALAGKVSTPRIGEHLNEWIGLSYLIGRIFDPMAVLRLRHMNVRDNIVPRWRVGLDGQKVLGPMRFRFEISGGKDAGRAKLMGEFFELQYVLDKKSAWYSYVQMENLTQDWRRSDTTVRLGLTHILSANYNLQFVVSKDMNVMWGRRDTWVGLLLYGQIGWR